jgi:cytoskeletal protein RodZ
VSIGEELAQARRRAGLSVTQVSRRTCIREGIICAIERGDYDACGGDFYARGHIRAIARAVGADPGPLIAAYDAARPAPQTATAADLLRPVTPLRVRERHRLNWAAVLSLGLAAAVAFAGYYVIAGSRHAPAAPAAAGLNRASHRHPRHTAPPPAPTARAPAPNPYAHMVAIKLTATGDCWVEFTTPAGGYLSQLIVVGGTSRRWTFHHAVDMRLGDPGDVRLIVDGKNALPPGTVEPITLSLRPNGKISS